VTESRVSQIVIAAERELKRIILIRGEKMGIELETRACTCGCGNSFKCLPGSKQKYASAYCQELATGEAPAMTSKRRGRPKKKREDEMMTGNIEKDFARAEEDLDEDLETDLEETQEESEPEVDEGNGRFTMTIPDACAQFSLPRSKIQYWITKGYIATFKAGPKKILLDPTDIGMMIENGPKAKRAIEEDEAELDQQETLDAAKDEEEASEDAPELETAPVVPAKRSTQPKTRRKPKAIARGRARKSRIVLAPAHWYALGTLSGGILGAAAHFLVSR
jgi:hypothetical protein